MREAVVVHASPLRTELCHDQWLPRLITAGCSTTHMFQAVPLRADLGIEMDFIVKCLEPKTDVQIDEFVIELLPSKASKLDIVKRPIQLDMLPGRDLSACFFHHSGCQKINRWRGQEGSSAWPTFIGNL